MVVVGDSYIVRRLLDGGLCILHGHTHAGKAYHRAVIEAVAAGHKVVAGQTPAFQQTAEAHVLGDPQRHSLDEEGAGRVEVDLARKLFPACLQHLAAAGGVRVMSILQTG